VVSLWKKDGRVRGSQEGRALGFWREGGGEDLRACGQMDAVHGRDPIPALPALDVEEISRHSRRGAKHLFPRRPIRVTTSRCRGAAISIDLLQLHPDPGLRFVLGRMISRFDGVE
jgi:hypothetical protein